MGHQLCLATIACLSIRQCFTQMYDDEVMRLEGRVDDDVANAGRRPSELERGR